MSNPNNCETCDYKHMKGPDDKPDQHCYMFQDVPNEQCMQHTGHKKYAEEMRAAFPGIFRHDGSIDIIAVATRAAKTKEPT